MKPAQLSKELREGESEYLDHRRGIVALGLAAASAMGLVGLYQMGIIKHLPEPPLPSMDADKVDASGEAYGKLQMPDAFLGLGSYAATLSLAVMGGQDRATTHPWIPLVLLAKASLDAAQAGKLTVDQAVKHRAFCVWCLLAAAATFATVPLCIPEALAAFKRLRR